MTAGATKKPQKRAKARPAAPAAQPDRDPSAFVNRLPKGETIPHATALLAVDGVLGNSRAIQLWSADVIGSLDLTETVGVLADVVNQVKRNDLGAGEALLVAQANTLNAVFVNLAVRAKTTNLLEHFDKYLRLALKAQGQCRATLETLAAIKNPPMVFARQANIAHGPQQVNNSQGPQQVNNCLGGETADPSRARENGSVQNELLEAESEPRQLESGRRLDASTSSITGKRDPTLAPVGVLNRAENR
jgi:hypothetical protein